MNLKFDNSMKDKQRDIRDKLSRITLTVHAKRMCLPYGFLPHFGSSTVFSSTSLYLSLNSSLEFITLMKLEILKEDIESEKGDKYKV